MADKSEWKSVTIDRKEIIAADRGRVEIEWKLAGDVDGDWVGCFNGDGQRTGSIDYGTGATEPQASPSGVRWEVAESNMADANSYVTRAVASTNHVYRVLVDQRERKRQELLEKAAEDKRKAELLWQINALE